jgi:hypothetical protein
MLNPKIEKRINRLAEKYYTRLLLKNIEPIDVKKSEYIFIFNQTISKFTGKLYILVSHELSKQGIPSCFQYGNELWDPYSPRIELDGYEISNSFTSEQRFCIKPLKQQPFFKWSVDIENKIIEAEGINFFPYINNTLRTIQKRYNVFFNDQDSKPGYDDLVQTCDLLLKHFIFLKDYAQKNKKRIRLVGFESEYVPNGILKKLCDKLSYKGDIEYIEMGRGYKYYFGQHHPKESFIYYSNLTRTGLETGMAISNQEWTRKDNKQIKIHEMFKPISNAIEKKAFDNIPKRQEKIIEALEKYKSERKKVFLLVSHVFYDTPTNDETESFTGMCDWIIETVKYFYGKENILLIKPHPAELIAEQPKRTPNETLESFLCDFKLTENILLLEPHQFTLKKLCPFISCGLIWRSSVAMELTFLGIPSIIAGNPYYRILDLNFAKNKDHYFKMIEQSHLIKITNRQKEDVATYLYLLDEKHTQIECISYDKVRKFHWNRKALRKYLKYGDEKIKSIVENIVA